MRKIRKYVLIFVVFLSFICNVHALNNPYPKYEESVFGGKIINCTWYAWQQAKDNMGVELPLWANVQTWYSKAAKAGYSVGKEPKANSLMVWNYGEGFGGHVAYVTSVNGTTVNYKEGGSPMTADGINSDSMTLDMMSSFLVGFIYLDDVPKTTQTNDSTSSSSSSTKQTIKKSSNAYLSQLTISDIDFTFNKDVLEYSFVVNSNIESINIDAKVEDGKAKIEGLGEQKLEVGLNTFNLVVTAEDGTKKTYKVDIKRKDNNAYLKHLSISDVEVQFEKGTFAYEIMVRRDLESVTIDAITESEFSTVLGVGEYFLTEEENIINITVIAEDETEQIYTIKICKEPKVEETIYNNKRNMWIIIISFLTSIVLIVILFLKRRKNK